jgi:hypothetical protein
MRHLDCELRVRFWPNPSAQVRLKKGGGWSAHPEIVVALFGVYFGNRCINRYDMMESQMMNACSEIAFESRTHFAFDELEDDADALVDLDRVMTLSLSSLPAEVSRCLPYLGEWRWSFIILAARCEVLEGLLQVNPALCCLWAQHYQNGVQSPGRIDLIQQTCSQSQVKQLSGLGLPSTQTWARIFSKIPLGQVWLLNLASLQKLSFGQVPNHMMEQLKSASAVSAHFMMLLSNELYRLWMSHEDFDYSLLNPGSDSGGSYLREFARLERLDSSSNA